MKVRLVLATLVLVSAAMFGGLTQPSTAMARHARSAVGAKHIVISLARQELYAYKGHRLVWRSPVTTGDRLLPTPAGHFAIFAKYSPFEFISPWPSGSPFWYPPSWVTYAMEFIRGGYFIHDAPWRSVFGPGSNSGTAPGTNYGGTHGCVNTPFATAKFLWYWAPIGTPVDVG
jgi:lipoprotein-anchoring transpeptidase ErfK/SrfK